MRAKLRHLAANLVLLAASLFVSPLFAELVVFGIFLKPDDVLANISLNGVVRAGVGSRGRLQAGVGDG
jgi:hypothetical protein